MVRDPCALRLRHKTVSGLPRTGSPSVWIVLGWRIAGSAGHGHVTLDSALRGGLSQYAHCPALDLPDPFLAYAHRGPDLLQGQRLLTMNEAKTTHDNLPLPLVESLEDPFDLRLPLTLRRLLLVRSARASSTALNISELLVRKRSR